METKTLTQLENEGVIELGRGKVISAVDIKQHTGEYPVYSASQSGSGEFGKYGKYDFDEELITWSVDGGGKFFYRPKHRFSITNVSGFIRIHDSSKLDYKYLYYSLTDQWSRQDFNYINKAHPSNIRDLYKIKLIPISEQRQMSKYLDGFFVDVERGIGKVAQSKMLGTKILDNTVNALFSDSSAQVRGWKKVKLKDIFDFYNGKAHEKEIKSGGKYKVINSKFVSTNGAVYKNTDKALLPLSSGDITMVMSDVPNGKALAKSFMVDENNTYTLNQRICALRPKVELSIPFFHYQLNRNKYFLSFDNGQRQTNLRKEDILECPLFIPDIHEQKAIASRLDKAKSFSNELSLKLDEQSHNFDGLRTSALAGMFQVMT